ncbi:glycosyltransferase family 2 protein [Yoonia sp.]|uniref:glycosyltransferase family 2 protein n=1 Tax=Yoonia sp. TaxID=2212373 RepID=UPI003F6BFE5C
MTLSISIVIPTYNRATLVPRAVRSALDACPDDAEVIVVDDHSDTAAGALADLVSDPRLLVLANAGDKGAGGARNFGVDAASGDIILFLDDDDVMVGDYAERVMAAVMQSDADFGFSNMGTITSIDAPLYSMRVKKLRGLTTGLVDVNVPLVSRMPGLGCGFWVRRDVFRKIGPICTDLKVDEDGDFYCRLYGLDHKGWFEEQPGCIVSKGYIVAAGAAPQLTQSTDPAEEAACYLRTLHRNQDYFGPLSPERWHLIRRALRKAAFYDVDTVALDVLRDLKPFSWRVKGWLFWQMKKRGKKIHQRRIAQKG